jgi:hypothetical protein
VALVKSSDETIYYRNDPFLRNVSICCEWCDAPMLGVAHYEVKST